LAYSFAQVVLITYMSSLASTKFAASQYALMTSLCALILWSAGRNVIESNFVAAHRY
jgi:hypothetical protein